jgi:hypothetical protein
MPLDQRRQDELGLIAIPVPAGGLEPFEEFAVGQAGQRADIIKCPEMTEHDGAVPSSPSRVLSQRKAILRDGCPQCSRRVGETHRERATPSVGFSVRL